MVFKAIDNFENFAAFKTNQVSREVDQGFAAGAHLVLKLYAALPSLAVSGYATLNQLRHGALVSIQCRFQGADLRQAFGNKPFGCRPGDHFAKLFDKISIFLQIFERAVEKKSFFS